MAATAYAFLVSLQNTMNQIQIHSRLSPCFYNFQFESLREKVDFLVDFVENHSDAIVPEEVDLLVENADSSEAEDLLNRIAVAAQKAEDIIEVEAADIIRDGSTEVSLGFSLDLRTIIGDVDYIMTEEAIRKKEENRGFQESTSPMATPSTIANTSISKMVGFDGYSEQLLDELTGHHSSRRIIPIVGMGGIGKTTLAISVYENLLTLHHFDVRVWVTISQSFSVMDILVQALSCLGEPTRTSDGNNLVEKLHKNLYGRRYLIILDDMWSIEAWERIQFFFPENNNGSRIIVTTRQQEVVGYFGSSALVVDFLDEKNSWDLFCDKIFAQEHCPSQLEAIGRKIVRKCKGLPLAIGVVGGLLGKSPRTLEYWEKIAKDKSLILEYSGEGNKALSILYLSYKHLPVCLKSCFLYLGLFPEDYNIQRSQLIQLWIAEGFIKGKRNQNLEEVGENYIKDLVDRNLLLVVNGKVGICGVHDVVRELCIRIAERENFYWVQRDVDGMRHFIVDETSARFFLQQSPATSKRPSLLNPLILDGQTEREAPFELKSRLLRVFVGDIRCLNRSSQEVNLRFLMHKLNLPSSYAMPTYRLPSSISLCWSLQTLDMDIFRSVYMPLQMWKMPQLRHIHISSTVYLDDPPKDDVIVLQNLQTLENVRNLNLSEEVCKRIPNIKYLHIHNDLNEQGVASWHLELQNIWRLNKLESLTYLGSGMQYAGHPVQNPTLPSSLKKLVLFSACLVGSDMSMIASLPHLQFLELRYKAAVVTEWICVEEGFLSLKHLCILYWNDLVNWIAESSSFPVLESLSLEGLFQLKEIPSGIGEIPTLREIRVRDCNKSVTMSAVKILEEQENLGNEDLLLQLSFFDETNAQMWTQNIQEMEFTSQNLHISVQR